MLSFFLLLASLLHLSQLSFSRRSSYSFIRPHNFIWIHQNFCALLH